MARGELAGYETPLLAYADKLASITPAALAGDRVALQQIVTSHGMRIGSDLVQRLLVNTGCASTSAALEIDDAVPDQFEKRPSNNPPETQKVLPEAGERQAWVPREVLRGLNVSRTSVVAGLGGLLLFAAAAMMWYISRTLRNRPMLLRTHTRRRCRYQAFLQSEAGECRALVIDISGQGVQLLAPTWLSRGDEIKITLGEVALEAEVMWRRDYSAGIRFERELTEDELKTLAPESADQLAA